MSEIDPSCPICTKTSYDPARYKDVCQRHRKTYKTTLCKECGKFVLSEYKELCDNCMFATPMRKGMTPGGRKNLKGHKTIHRARWKRPKFVLDVDGPNNE